MQKQLQERLIRYAKINTRSDESSPTVPSSENQLDLLNLLVDELQELGLSGVEFNPKNAFVTAHLPANTDREIPAIGFIAHVDTADYNAENVQPQVVEDYQGQTLVLNQDQGIEMSPDDFPNLNNYHGDTLITTDGTTLLGADDKAGIAEIMTAMDYLIQNPEVQHGPVYVAFGPDEEIGRGADLFDVDKFPVAYAYTMDGGPLGELQYESFNAAQAVLDFQGLSVHPGTAKDQMVNAITLMTQWIESLPADQVPERTQGREGFFHLVQASGHVEEAQATLIVRDHDRQAFEEKKDLVRRLVDQMNQDLGEERVHLTLEDQYYNMVEVIEKDMRSVEIATQAMESLDIPVLTEPIRGGTDGSKISFMGIPTPNLFAGGENMHGRFEYVSVQTMEKATQTILKIIELQAQAD